MSGALPTPPDFATVGLSSVHNTLVSKSHSGKRQARAFGGHLWRFTARYPRMSRAEFMPIYAFLLSQKGRFDSFTVVPPDLATPQGVATGTPNSAEGSPTGNTVNTQGWTPSVTGIMKAGDVFKFAGHSKVYMVTADADSDAGGLATLQFEPDIVANVAGTEVITVSNVPFTMALTNDVQSYKAGPPTLYTFELDLEEVVV